jgi:hypothetical protein
MNVGIELMNANGRGRNVQRRIVRGRNGSGKIRRERNVRGRNDPRKTDYIPCR